MLVFEGTKIRMMSFVIKKKEGYLALARIVS
jgi:hypothetical protein